MLLLSPPSQLSRRVAALPAGPPRRVIGNTDPAFLDQRREELQAWLRLVRTGGGACGLPS